MSLCVKVGESEPISENPNSPNIFNRIQVNTIHVLYHSGYIQVRASKCRSKSLSGNPGINHVQSLTRLVKWNLKGKGIGGSSNQSSEMRRTIPGIEVNLPYDLHRRLLPKRVSQRTWSGQRPERRSRGKSNCEALLPRIQIGHSTGVLESCGSCQCSCLRKENE